MVIDSQFRKCVTYIYADIQDEEIGKLFRKPIATGFFVSVPLKGEQFQAIYVLTAKHVIEKSQEYGPLYIRFNTKDGRYVDVATNHDLWQVHNETDIAAVPIPLPKNSDIKYIPISLFATKDYVEKKNISEGDEVFFCGLFQGYSGASQVQPIIRFGNISLMPYERIPIFDKTTRMTSKIEAYLVECRSYGGHSGSPVFLVLKPDRYVGRIDISSEYPIRLLGVVTHHFELSKEVKFSGDVFGKGIIDQNAGIAIVIPVSYISDLLMNEYFIQQRENLLKNNEEHGK